MQPVVVNHGRGAERGIGCCDQYDMAARSPCWGSRLCSPEAPGLRRRPSSEPCAARPTTTFASASTSMFSRIAVRARIQGLGAREGLMARSRAMLSLRRHYGWAVLIGPDRNPAQRMASATPTPIRDADAIRDEIDEAGLATANPELCNLESAAIQRQHLVTLVAALRAVHSAQELSQSRRVATILTRSLFLHIFKNLPANRGVKARRGQHAADNVR
jgi:hypothetical protein